MSKEVQKIFTDLSGNYDTINKLCSSGTMVLWRKEAAREAMLDKRKYSALDIGTGTGELAFEIYKEGKRNGKNIGITGIDFSRHMVDIANRKAKTNGIKAKFELGDALHLKYKNCSFDLVTSGFVVKNVDNQARLASESYRILKKGGRLVFIELIRPQGNLNRLMINAYWTTIIRLGFMGSAQIYRALKKSVDKFNKNKFAERLKKAGFRNVRVKVLFSGAAAMFLAEK
ncbi:MAG: class I SAM-dependent methyltransferase [Candidatus Micrarchaeota archaeon]|nr:class I SAM-dependent methyltransferase [Candidatus Micrarchaeota archaeon]MDE1860010.1 class I SAM-dependent methyltransferase [Candidatus Micrarchaeota archaeon]